MTYSFHHGIPRLRCAPLGMTGKSYAANALAMSRRRPVQQKPLRGQAGERLREIDRSPTGSQPANSWSWRSRRWSRSRSLRPETKWSSSCSMKSCRHWRVTLWWKDWSCCSCWRKSLRQPEKDSQWSYCAPWQAMLRQPRVLLRCVVRSPRGERRWRGYRWISS